MSVQSPSPMVIKASIGKLNITFDPKDLELPSGFELLDFTSQAALLLKNLSRDRIEICMLK